MQLFVQFKAVLDVLYVFEPALYTLSLIYVVLWGYIFSLVCLRQTQMNQEYHFSLNVDIHL